ncbi:MAG: hypothetical protein ACRD1R_16105 [Acidobacteriota bacterium]
MTGKDFSRLILILTAFLLGCSSALDGDGRLTVGVAFETLQREGWVAGFEAIKEKALEKDIEIIEAIADGYLDADGVQDLYYESAAAVQAILDMIEGRESASHHRGRGLRYSPRQPGRTLSSHVGLSMIVFLQIQM